MADTVVYPLVGAVIEKAQMIGQVGDDLDAFFNSLSRIQDLLTDAEARQMFERSVKNWLAELKDVVYDADDVVEEIAYEALGQQAEGQSNKDKRKQVQSFFPFRSCFGLKQVPFKLDTATRIKDINARLERINEAGRKFSFRRIDYETMASEKTTASENIDRRPPTTSFLARDESEPLGRDKERGEIIELLLSSDGTSGGKHVTVISIVGMGGIGKTTLAQVVYNDQNVENHFDIKAWVCVAEDFDISRLTKEILESFAKRSYDLSALDLMQRYLQNMLHGKKFLIVLDDVWNAKRSAWNRLLAPFSVGARGSKIMVTTRNEAVSRALNTDHVYHLKHLGEMDCLSLFLRHAFVGENSDAYPELMKIGEELVKRCHGTPLAAKVLGSLLSTKREINYWEIVKYVFYSSRWMGPISTVWMGSY